MAEFKEIIKYIVRKEANPHTLTDRVSLDIWKDDDELYVQLNDTDVLSLNAFEADILDWAAANPEPRYPTFLEHVHSVFPNCIDDEICVEYLYGEKYRTSITDCQHFNCQQCWNRIMPKELADKLGVKKQKIIPLIGVVK